ncbi:uncharacterized protein LOC5518697 isoform X2 [Nematostella vectensis]|uniref:uncharacterized protein LOC5518697 isoform X2 n=1 Tax=Nematostella vectensis TaxID=45351 RepID=UPI0020774337|nr:uncharacterized protein LOC5518697 isoform X2 [Nematostella vectensis]
MTIGKMSKVGNLPPPVFNKRLFKAQAGILLSEEILRILRRSPQEERSLSELSKLKAVVNGLKEIHKDLQYIKDALGYAINYEKVESGKTVTKQHSEKVLSCYYVLSGSVEAQYSIDYDEEDIRGKIAGKDAQGNSICEINYTHVAGDYMGLVSADGPQYDLPPPDSMRTIETCEFIRIDRETFHKSVKKVQNRYVQEIEMFLEESEILRKLPAEERAVLVPLMAKQEYSAGKVIINQGEIPEHVFFVGKGRCHFFRRVYIQEARRQELVKLGLIEKGSFFGESTVLGGSPCFCSVASIGPVTCYLVNKWAIKTNERILNLLRDHQHFFHEDDMIKHFIRDSDVWQSYKRSKVIELLDGTNKQHVVVCTVPETLHTAVEFGDASRRYSSHSTNEREPGEPKKKEPLFITPRSRRRSSAFLQSNAAAVVKAVLLLRRNTGSEEPRVPSSNAESSPVTTTRGEMETKIKPMSAPGRCRGAPKSLRDASNSPTRNRSRNRGGRPKTKTNNQRSPSGERASSSVKKKQAITKHGKDEKKVKDEKPKTVPNNKAPEYQSEAVDKHSTPPRGTEMIVTSNRNFILKEVINTGLPGKRVYSAGYQRFDKSMFDILDKSEPSPSGPSPWTISLAANRWMSSVRKKRAMVRSMSDRRSSSPSPTPIIVIEEYVATSDSNVDDEGMARPSSGKTDDRAASSRSPSPSTRRISHTPSPVLTELPEENEDEVLEYEKYEAGKAIPEKWHTPIHEARDQSLAHLERVKQELEAITRDREILHRQIAASGMTRDEHAQNDVALDSIDHTQETTVQATTEESKSSTRKHSPQKNRKLSYPARTLSSGSDKKTSGSHRMSLGSSHAPALSSDTSHARLMRMRTLDGCYLEGIGARSSLYSSRLMNNERINDKSSVSAVTRNERRRLLLLDKLGLR